MTSISAGQRVPVSPRGSANLRCCPVRSDSGEVGLGKWPQKASQLLGGGASGGPNRPAPCKEAGSGAGFKRTADVLRVCPEGREAFGLEAPQETLQEGWVWKNR